MRECCSLIPYTPGSDFPDDGPPMRLLPRAHWWLPGATALFACATSSTTLPFDARPAMGVLRADTEAIGRALANGHLRDAGEPAARIAEVRLSVGYAHEVDPVFRSYEAALRDQAKVLSEAIEADQPAVARAAFSGLLDRCDRCHATFRPGGVSGSRR